MLSTLASSTSAAPRWMEELSENIEPFLESAREIHKRRKDLYDAYIEWLRTSGDTVKRTSKLRDEIVDANRRNNYVQVGGASGGIFGGILSIIGVVGDIPNGGTSLLVVGGVVATCCTVASIGSYIARNLVNEKLCKKVNENLEANKTSTDLFAEKCKSYFDALEKFYSFFRTIGGNDVALSLFYEFADEEGFGFLDDLRLDRLSKRKVISGLQEIIDSDVTNLVPKMWSVEFLKCANSKMKSLGDKIRNMLGKLKDYIESDPYLSRLIRNKIRNLLIDKLKNNGKPKFENVLQILATFGVATSAKIGVQTVNNLNAKLSREGMSKAIRAGLVVANTAFAVLSLVDLIKSLINLENDSQSDESKNITDAIDVLKRARKDIREQMENNFGW